MTQLWSQDQRQLCRVFYFYLQEKHVNTVAVGIGPGVNMEILQQIAGTGNPVVYVEDFSPNCMSMRRSRKSKDLSVQVGLVLNVISNSIGQKQLYTTPDR